MIIASDAFPIQVLTRRYQLQLAPGDEIAFGVKSTVAIGGVDRNKYTGAMDW